MVKRVLSKRNRKPDLPPVLHPVERDKWPEDFQSVKTLKEFWISRHYTVQIYAVLVGTLDPCPVPGRYPHERLTITNTGIATEVRADIIPRDAMMDLKLQCGRGGQWAVEVYPDLDRGVSIPEARHLFIFNEKPEFC